MNIGKRGLSQTLGAIFQKRHYVALTNMAKYAIPFGETFRRYLFGGGMYPFRITVKTPAGLIRPTLYSYYDLLTLNEIFFRDDYGKSENDIVIVDIGSNIGLSALYFLTRNANSRVYLFEPDPKNVERLNANLGDFKGRTFVNACAVADQDGVVRFGIDTISGRYGGIGIQSGTYMDLPCRHINSVLEEILRKERKIDVLKIDTEGTELSIVNAIAPEHLARIDEIYMEASPTGKLFPETFRQSQEGTVCHLFRTA